MAARTRVSRTTKAVTKASAKRRVKTRPTPRADAPPTAARLQAALAALEAKGTRRNVDGMARFGLVAERVFGVSVKDTQALAKSLGRDHALAQALFKSGWYEARLLAAFVEEPEVITKAEMDAWARGFENWGDCDTAVMHCFDRSPHAWAMTRKWVKAKEELVKRAGFAMLASMALHHKTAPSAPFIAALAWIEQAATDERHLVKKAVNWALRSIGSRDEACHAAAVSSARRLAARVEPPARWNGKDALRQLSSAATARRVARGSVRDSLAHRTRIARSSLARAGSFPPADLRANP